MFDYNQIFEGKKKQRKTLIFLMRKHTHTHVKSKTINNKMKVCTFNISTSKRLYINFLF